jgi:hypothetical protein
VTVITEGPSDIVTGANSVVIDPSTYMKTFQVSATPGEALYVTPMYRLHLIN